MLGGARVTQELVVSSEDRVGLLAGVTGVLYEMGINLLAVSVQTEGGAAVVHLTTEANLYARDALRGAGFDVSMREIVEVEIAHRTGFLCKLTEALARKGLTIEDLHLTAVEGCERTRLQFCASNNIQAAQLLRGK